METPIKQFTSPDGWLLPSASTQKQEPVLPDWLLSLDKRKASITKIEGQLKKLLKARLAHNLTPYQSGWVTYTWGDGFNFNAVPQILEDAILNNGIALTAIDTLASYCVGNGFVNEAYNDLTTRLYSNQKVGKRGLLRCLKQLATMAIWYDGAFAIRVIRNIDTGDIISFEPLQIGNIRISASTIGNIRSYRYSDIINRQAWNYGLDEILLEFDPELTPAEAKANIEAFGVQRYRGEVYYHYVPKPGAPYYPLPPMWASLDLIRGYSASEKAFNKKAVQAWLPNVVITTPMLSTERNNGISEQEAMQGSLARVSKGDADSSLIHIQQGTGQSNPVQVTNLQNTTPPADMVNVISLSGQEVCKLVGIDPVIVGFSTPGQLGNNQQLKQAQTMAINRGKSIMHPILDICQMLLEEMGNTFAEPLEIKQLNLFTQIDPEILRYTFQAYEANELRVNAGFEPSKNQRIAGKTMGDLTLNPLVDNNLISNAMTVKQALDTHGYTIDPTWPTPDAPIRKIQANPGESPIN
jgi:hypothetical protein